MNVKCIRGQLADVLGDELAHVTWKDALGANMLIQIIDINTNEYLTIFDIINIDQWNHYLADEPYVEDVGNDIAAVNALIETHNMDIYIVTNEGLMNANILELVNKGLLDLEDLLPEWSDQQELEYLFNKGCSGIQKGRKYPTLT